MHNLYLVNVGAVFDIMIPGFRYAQFVPSKCGCAV